MVIGWVYLRFSAIQFDPSYIYNPLVFGTAGIIPISDIDKEMTPDLKVIAVGGRTGRDGLKGATFSSMALDTGTMKKISKPFR